MLTINPQRPPTRSQLFNIIKSGLERHNMAFTLPSIEIAERIAKADLDKLLDLALLAITKDEDNLPEADHKELFIAKCSELGLE